MFLFNDIRDYTQNSSVYQVTCNPLAPNDDQLSHSAKFKNGKDDWSHHPERVKYGTLLYGLQLIYSSLIYRVSQKECARLREGVPYVKVYRYNPKHLYPNLNGYGDNGERSLKLWKLLYTYW
jgi:hypothetical protein